MVRSPSSTKRLPAMKAQRDPGSAGRHRAGLTEIGHVDAEGRRRLRRAAAQVALLAEDRRDGHARMEAPAGPEPPDHRGATGVDPLPRQRVEARGAVQGPLPHPDAGRRVARTRLDVAP